MSEANADQDREWMMKPRQADQKTDQFAEDIHAARAAAKTAVMSQIWACGGANSSGSAAKWRQACAAAATMRALRRRIRHVPTTLSQSDLPGLDLIHRGKVSDGYALSRDDMLIVATDRLSAFDVVLPDPIPGKGEMLCQISNFWFAKTAHLAPNHLTGKAVADVLPAGVDAHLYTRRSVVTKRLKPVPIEAIARGYLIGSGWKDYQAT